MERRKPNFCLLPYNHSIDVAGRKLHFYIKTFMLGHDIQQWFSGSDDLTYREHLKILHGSRNGSNNFNSAKDVFGDD